MKILKLPFETQIKCECGCEFEFDYDDLDIKNERVFCYDDYMNFRTLSIKCPFCNKENILEKKQVY